RRPLGWIATFALAVAVITGPRALGPAATAAAPGRIVSLELAGDPADAQAVLDSWSAAPGAIAEARRAVLWDDLFIPSYALLLGAVCVFAGAAHGWRSRQFVAALPALAALLDWVENRGLIRMIDGQPPARWSLMVSRSATIKFSFLAVAALYVVAAGLYWLGPRLVALAD